jgi:surface polysaccharide O-acyltransferase-like enzyme
MQAVQIKTKTLRDTDTDLMRIIACFLVVMIHASSAEGMGMVYNALSRFSVPVFVLISGYYLLRRPPSAIRIVRRIGSLVGIHVLWSVLYYIFYRLMGDLPRATAGDVIRYLLTQPTHLWYLYALAGLWLLLPPLQTFARHASEEEYRYALWVTGILGTVVTLGMRSGISGLFSAIIENTKIPYAMGFVFLFLMGGYLYRFPVRRVRIWYIAGAVGMAATIILALLLPREMAVSIALSFYAPGPVLAAIAFFIGIKRTSAGGAPIWRRGAPYLRPIAAASGGVYLLHPMILRLYDQWMAPLFSPEMAWLSIPLGAVWAFALSMVIVMLARKIPGVRQVLL